MCFYLICNVLLIYCCFLVERRDHHSPIPETHKWGRSSSREKSDFSHRPDKYSYKSWIDDKVDSPSKSANYFEVFLLDCFCL